MSRFIDVIAMFLIYSIFFYKKWKVKGKDIIIVNTLMYVYICLVLYVTLMPIIVSLPFINDHPYRTMNLLPFADLLNGRGIRYDKLC